MLNKPQLFIYKNALTTQFKSILYHYSVEGSSQIKIKCTKFRHVAPFPQWKGQTFPLDMLTSKNAH